MTTTNWRKQRIFSLVGFIRLFLKFAVVPLIIRLVSQSAQPAGSAIFYFQSKWAADEGSVSGVLAVDDGCFRVDGHTILWPPNVWPDEDAEPLKIMFRANGVEALLFAVGDEVTLPGSEKTAVDYRFFENKVSCPGPFWGVAALSPE